MPSPEPEPSPPGAYADDPGVRAMLAWQAGDEASFDELVELYSGQVYALLTRFLGRKASREDLVQEVFLRVIRARDRYQPTARFSTWLYRIVFNLAVNETQRVSGNEPFSLDQPLRAGDEGGSLGELEIGPVETPSEGLEREDVVHAVRSAIARLPEQQRMALILAKYHDTPYVEIALVLGSSEKAIKSLVHRARESLRTMLAPFLQPGELA
jgi:RNA polymerase sigma-70 factor (ECF subfamily)